MAIHGGVVAAIFLFLTAIWAVTTRGNFWPAWVLLGLAIPLGVHFRRSPQHETRPAHAPGRDARDVPARRRRGAGRRAPPDRARPARRRAGAAGRARHEPRDGRAEVPTPTRKAPSSSSPRRAPASPRRSSELRDLARGIYPPVLADRGIGAALETLADRSPLPTTVDRRPRRAPARTRRDGRLLRRRRGARERGQALGRDQGRHLRRPPRTGCSRSRSRDDGRGGADAAGSGLVGLRRRVEALDGTLTVESPAGGPTTIRAELPCAS